MKLLSSYDMGDLKLDNRVVMAPMTRGRAGAEMTANELMAEYYKQRAGAGLLISEGTFPARSGVGWIHAPGIYTDEMAEGWKPTTEAVHGEGTPIFLQLWHTGRTSHPDFLDGETPVAPSAIKPETKDIRTPKTDGEKVPHVTPRALETEEIPKLIEEIRQSAQRAKDVGFDGVEIHGANGYLIDEFLQSCTNHREDKYGGSIEKRFQFLKETLEAILTVFPANRIGVRISPQGNFNDMGSDDFREQFLYVAEQLNQHDLAYLHVMIGLGFGFHEKGDPMTLNEFRDVYNGCIMANCGFDQQSAEDVLQSGGADLISFGRPFISNPDLVERFRNNWELDTMHQWKRDTRLEPKAIPTGRLILRRNQVSANYSKDALPDT